LTLLCALRRACSASTQRKLESVSQHSVSCCSLPANLLCTAAWQLCSRLQVPALIYQIEEFERLLIRLSKASSGKQ
jgi:hypothetical protein